MDSIPWDDFAVPTPPYLLVPSVSFVSYLIFKVYEPSRPLSVFPFLVAVPALLVLVLRHQLSSLLIASPVILLSYYALILIFTLAYRLSPCHPLARYPGPLLCKISNLWLAYVTARDGKSHQYVYELHKLHGDVVRIGPNELSISHKDVPTILSAQGCPRGPYYDSRVHPAGISLDGIRDMKYHAARRRPWSRGMSTTAIKYYEDLLRHNLASVTTSLQSRVGQKIDISAWMTYYGFDFMGQMAFSYDFNMKEQADDPLNILGPIDRAASVAAWFSHISWAGPYLQYLPGAIDDWAKMKALGAEMVKHRLSLGSNQRDLFSFLADEEGLEPVKPSLGVCSADGMLAIIAGADTSATTLSHLWYFLLTNPSYLKCLRQEVDGAFPGHQDVSMLDFSTQGTMPYLNACINEALRLLPPVLGGLQRRVMPGTGGRTIGPYFVPEGNQITLSAYVIQRDPKHFSPLPDTFWPDRWLTQDKYVLPSGEVIPRDEVTTNKDVFMPFSQGPMVCAGKNVALLEIRALMCAVLSNFDLEIADQKSFERWTDELRDVFVSGRGSLFVKLQSRV